MDIIRIVAIFLYLASAVSYFAYLFLQKRYLHHWGYLLVFGGFVAHTILIGSQFVQSGQLPVENLHQTLSIAGWAIAGVYLVFQYKFNLKVLGSYATPLIAFVMVVAHQFPLEPLQQTKGLSSLWVVFHVIAIFLGEAAFALACGAGALYLFQEHALKTKKRGFFYRRLPSLDLLDTVGYACIITGFSLLTLGLIVGFAYAEMVWGRFWSGDPKEVWSGITWLFYAALLHERLTVGWRGRKAAIMAIIGFAVLLFTFLGVNFLMEGHHGVFTRQ